MGLSSGVASPVLAGAVLAPWQVTGRLACDWPGRVCAGRKGRDPGVTQREGGEAPGGTMTDALVDGGVMPLTMPLECPGCADLDGRDPG